MVQTSPSLLKLIMSELGSASLLTLAEKNDLPTLGVIAAFKDDTTTMFAEAITEALFSSKVKKSSNSRIVPNLLQVAPKTIAIYHTIDIKNYVPILLRVAYDKNWDLFYILYLNCPVFDCLCYPSGRGYDLMVDMSVCPLLGMPDGMYDYLMRQPHHFDNWDLPNYISRISPLISIVENYISENVPANRMLKFLYNHNPYKVFDIVQDPYAMIIDIFFNWDSEYFSTVLVSKSSDRHETFGVFFTILKFYIAGMRKHAETEEDPRLNNFNADILENYLTFVQSNSFIRVLINPLFYFSSLGLGQTILDPVPTGEEIYRFLWPKYNIKLPRGLRFTRNEDWLPFSLNMDGIFEDENGNQLIDDGLVDTPIDFTDKEYFSDTESDVSYYSSW